MAEYQDIRRYMKEGRYRGVLFQLMAEHRLEGIYLTSINADGTDLIRSGDVGPFDELGAAWKRGEDRVQEAVDGAAR